MTNKLKIDIVSDVVCPWCTIGYKRLEKAIIELGVQDKIDITWQPFELNPNIVRP
jgi:predicted DsbA family dithiol-disulfide isomerase